MFEVSERVQRLPGVQRAAFKHSSYEVTVTVLAFQADETGDAGLIGGDVKQTFGARCDFSGFLGQRLKGIATGTASVQDFAGEDDFGQPIDRIRSGGIGSVERPGPGETVA